MKRALLLLALGCGGPNNGDLFPERTDASTGSLEQPQADCRPVRVAGCYDPWNDRACFHVPDGCLTALAE